MISNPRALEYLDWLGEVEERHGLTRAWVKARCPTCPLTARRYHAPSSTGDLVWLCLNCGVFTTKITATRPGAGLDRRDTPRDVVLFPVPGQIPALNLAVTMIESGNDGGFSIQSPCDLPIGSVHHLEFIAAGQPLTRTGRVVHVTRDEGSSQPSFAIGFASESDS